MKIWKCVFALIPFLLINRALAQEVVSKDARMMPIYQNPQSQAYTYVIKEDGTGSVYLRVDGVTMKSVGGVYKLTLPDVQTGEVMAWYRENGCPQYQGDLCIWSQGNGWQVAETRTEGHDVTVVIPDRKVDKRDENTPITIGLYYKVGDVTEKKWWGREVAVTSALSQELITSLSIGVYLPDGVYTRDKQQGPGGWAASMNEMVARSVSSSPSPAMADSKMGIAYIDMAGSGQISSYRNNVAPGEDYTFRFMSATSAWKLFYREIGIAIVWIVAIAVVVAVLLYLVIGKKPWTWYLLVMSLLIVLFLLVSGLWVTYRFGLSDVGGQQNYPVMLNKAGVGGSEVVVPPIAPDETVAQ